MAETLIDLRDVPRGRAYEELHQHFSSALEGVDDPITAMATISSLVHHALGFLWTGFYRVVEPGRLLRVGPYQGTLGCIEIEFGRGICGLAAESGEPVIVDDVLEHPNHITCDPRARSEIVVPVFDARGDLIAVFDADSEEVAAFSDVDRLGMERILEWFAGSRSQLPATDTAARW
jgi:L-methionine (R)-S-oxide reductase